MRHNKSYTPIFKCTAPRRFSCANENDYEEFTEIERTLHLDDMVNHNTTTFSPIITNGRRSYIKGKGSVLWFSIAKPKEEHHWYGNVSFIIKLQDLLEHFLSTKKMYFMEIIERRSSLLSRVILTSRKLKSLKPAIQFEPSEVGFPLFKSAEGMYHSLKTLPDYNKGHELEFMIDIADKQEAQWIYSNCRKVVVNHSLGNTGAEYTCHNYHIFGQKARCKSPFSIEKTNEIIKSTLNLCRKNNKNNKRKALKGESNNTSSKLHERKCIELSVK
ncbi:unnamed protein product [Meganyctiphanes norvegica]|uniref:Uncharacterized protein n=1 Tax=Meganyctiphanes norvegica TaxID=48144 RepID=A0AAV2RA09_MEGNR